LLEEIQDPARRRVHGNSVLARQVRPGRDDIQMLAQQRALTQERRHLPGPDAQVRPGKPREAGGRSGAH
jgi:hypothetical protein